MRGRKDKKEIFRYKLEGENQWLIGSVAYTIGGPNYFSGGFTRRGYYFDASVETHNPDGSKSFMLFTGALRGLIQEAPRFSARVLAELIPDLQLVDTVIGALKAKNGFRFAGELQEAAA